MMEGHLDRVMDAFRDYNHYGYFSANGNGLETGTNENQKPEIHSGVKDQGTKNGVTNYLIVEPWGPKETVAFRKSAGGPNGGTLLVNCVGGCDGMEYIKISYGVKESHVQCLMSIYSSDNYA